MMMTDEETLRREEAARAGMSTEDALRVLRKWRDIGFPSSDFGVLFSRREALHRAIADLGEVAHLRDAMLEQWRVGNRLVRHNSLTREILAKVAAIQETGGGDPSQPYDAQISALTIYQARQLLAVDDTTSDSE